MADPRPERQLYEELADARARLAPLIARVLARRDRDPAVTGAVESVRDALDTALSVLPIELDRESGDRPPRR